MADRGEPWQKSILLRFRHHAGGMLGGPQKVDLKKGASARTIAIDPEMALAGEVSAKFALAEPIKW